MTWSASVARRCLRWLQVASAVSCTALVVSSALAAPAPLLLQRAQAVVVTAGDVPNWSNARAINLPHHWGALWPSPAGLVAYRLEFDADTADGALRGLLIDRACSTLQIRVNGQVVHEGGRLTEPVTRQCHQPLLIAVSAALLHPRGNVLELKLRGYAPGEVAHRDQAGGLSSIKLDTFGALLPGYRQRLWLATELPQVFSGTLVLMGGFMFLLGWFHRKQSYLAYFGALMIGWAVLLARLWWTQLPWSNRSTELLLAALAGFLTLAGVQFLMRYAGRRLRWLDVGLPVQLGFMVLSLVVAGPMRLSTLTSIWLTILGAQMLVIAGHYLWLQLRRRHRAQLLLMGPMLALVALAMLAEWLARQMALDVRVGQVALLVPPLVLVTVGLRLVQQYGRALQSAEQGRAELEVRIREATAQIERNFAQLAELKVEQVTARERKRIAADLHDDLGAKLLTIVHTSESERISTLAREALEEMRLSVRGLTGKPVRLSDALGDWRAEVVSRLAQSGVEAEWRSESDDDVPQTLSARAYVQTTRIMREAVSNVIKHSGATHCSIRCNIAGGDFELVIQDNGNGIPVELDGRLDKGHGMASMKGRAKQLQGQCLVESGPGYGTVIRLTLPLDRHATPT